MGSLTSVVLLTVGRPRDLEVLLIMANTGRLRPKGVEISLVELYERVGCLKGLTRCYACCAETIEWDLYHSFSRLSLLSVRAVTVKVREKEKQLGFQMKDTFLIRLNSLSSVLLLGRTIRCYRSSGKSHFFPLSVKQLVIVPFKFDFCRRQYHVTWARTKTS